MLDPGWLTRPLIDAFIILYLFVAWAWRHPVGTLGRIATEPLAGIVRWLGLGQDWSMFTPNPAAHGVVMQVIIKRRSRAARSKCQSAGAGACGRSRGRAPGRGR